MLQEEKPPLNLGALVLAALGLIVALLGPFLVFVRQPMLQTDIDELVLAAQEEHFGDAAFTAKAVPEKIDDALVGGYYGDQITATLGGKLKVVTRGEPFRRLAYPKKGLDTN